MHPISEALRPVLGQPSWLVKHGHGSFITMEYGKPWVTVGNPIQSRLHIEGAPVETLRRNAVVQGEWHLWVYCCGWSLMLADAELAHDESDPATIGRALYALNGQVLQAVEIEPADGRTTFTFDLGCSLLTYPAPPGSYGTEPVEQWMVYSRSGPALVIREDGTYSIGDDHQRSADTNWQPIGTPVRVSG